MDQTTGEGEAARVREVWATGSPRELMVEESWALGEEGVGRTGQRDRRSSCKKMGKEL